MAPPRLKRNLPYIHALSKARKLQRDALINTADKDLILCLCDCCHNFLTGNIPFTEDEIKKLLKYQHPVRYLGEKNRDPLQKKKAVIVQNGGFLPLLLTPILSTLGSLLLESIINK